jgi:preprotein translocase subunit SecF
MIYEKYEKHYKILMWIPIAALIVALVIIANSIITTGSFMQRDIELSGGKMITVQVVDADIAKVREAIPYATVHLTSGVTKNLLIEISFERDEDEVIGQLRSVVDFTDEPTVKIVGPALGQMFFQQAQLALIVAFIFMAIVVFILFRSLVPSSIVLLCAATDILVTIAVLNVLGVALSLPVIVALLTIIGYSVDTDILLTSELLKSGAHNASESIKRAVKTGLTMSCTTLVALFALYFVSGSIVLEQIAFALIIGIIVDIPATWLTNAGILRKWLEKKWAT